jgi:hypothetical protein
LALADDARIQALDRGWILRFDNDLLKPGEKDRDYSGGRDVGKPNRSTAARA